MRSRPGNVYIYFYIYLAYRLCSFTEYSFNRWVVQVHVNLIILHCTCIRF